MGPQELRTPLDGLASTPRPTWEGGQPRSLDASIPRPGRVGGRCGGGMAGRALAHHPCPWTRPPAAGVPLLMRPLRRAWAHSGT
jgi:hypothetical protein